METIAEVLWATFNDWWHIGSKAGKRINDDSKISNHTAQEDVGKIAKMIETPGTRLDQNTSMSDLGKGG